MADELLEKEPNKGFLSRVAKRLGLAGGEKKPQKPGAIVQQILRNDQMDLVVQTRKLQYEREKRYEDYDDMLSDAVIQAAVELYVDDALQFVKSRGAEYWVEGSKRAVVKSAAGFLEGLNPQLVHDWAYWMCAYGDFFPKLIGKQGEGITMVLDPYHPKDIRRWELNGYLEGFEIKGEKGLLQPWELAHWRMFTGGRKFQAADKYKRKDTGEIIYDTARYGTSVIEAARRIYKILQMVEDAIVAGRLARTMLTKLVSVMVGDLDIVSAFQLTSKIEDRIKSQIRMNNTSLEHQAGYKASTDPIVLPVMGDKGAVQIDELGGTPDVQGVKDLEHLRNKLFGALKIPAAFLGFAESLPGALGEGPLTRMAIRYARTVKRVQSAIINGLTDMIVIDLAYKGEDITGQDLRVELLEPSSAETLEHWRAMAEELTGIAGLLEFVENLGMTEKIDKQVIWNSILDNLTAIGFNPDELILGEDGEKKKEDVTRIHVVPVRTTLVEAQEMKADSQEETAELREVKEDIRDRIEIIRGKLEKGDS